MSNNLLPIIGIGIILVGVLLIVLYKYWGPGYKRSAVGYCPRHCGMTCCQETQRLAKQIGPAPSVSNAIPLSLAATDNWQHTLVKDF